MKNWNIGSGIAATCFAVALLAPALSVRGESPSEKPKPTPVLWPEAAAVKLQFRTEEVVFDSIPMKIGIVSGPGIEWENQFHDEWEPLARPPAEYSIAFRQRSGAPLTFAVTIFPPGTFLPNLKDEQWARYGLGLAETHGTAFRVLSESTALEDPAAGLVILGEPAREIVFTRKAFPTEICVEHDVIVEKKGRLIAFTLIGPESLVVEKADAFRLMIFQIGDRSGN